MAWKVDCTSFSLIKTDCFRYLVMLTPRSVPLIFFLEAFLFGVLFYAGFTSLWFLCSLFNAGFVFLSICHCLKSLFFSYGFHLEFYSSLNVSFVLISCEFPSVNFIHVSVPPRFFVSHFSFLFGSYFLFCLVLV